jgi:hypothetical protein
LLFGAFVNCDELGGSAYLVFEHAKICACHTVPFCSENMCQQNIIGSNILEIRIFMGIAATNHTQNRTLSNILGFRKLQDTYMS